MTCYTPDMKLITIATKWKLKPGSMKCPLILLLIEHSRRHSLDNYFAQISYMDSILRMIREVRLPEYSVRISRHLTMSKSLHVTYLIVCNFLEFECQKY